MQDRYPFLENTVGKIAEFDVIQCIKLYSFMCKTGKGYVKRMFLFSE